LNTQDIHLKDYRPSSHLITHTNLIFEIISEDNIVVSARLTVFNNPDADDCPDLVLYGALEKATANSETPTMELLELKVNGTLLNNKKCWADAM
jgi:hypothetical protein